MSAKICWCCQVNIIWKEYSGTAYLGENGEKPCFECAQEMEEDDFENED